MNNSNENEKKLSHERQMLIDIYDFGEDEVEKMSDEQVAENLLKKQKRAMRDSRNPNRFWILNDLPSPIEVKPTTSKKYGAWIVAALFITLALAFMAFMLLAFLK